MYKELVFHRNDVLIEQVREKILLGLKQDISSVSVLSYYLPSIVDIIPEGMGLSVPIDYPFGTSSSKLRQHATIAATRKGANTIDLVVNSLDILHDKKKQIENDLLSHIKICKDKDVSLRLMLEYRYLNKEQFYSICEIAKHLGIEYVFPSSGFMVDEYKDNLIVGLEIQKKYKLNVITNGNIWLKKQYDTIHKSDIFGVRLNKSGLDLVYNMNI